MWFIILPIAVLAVFFIAMFVDANFLNGKYLVRSRITSDHLKKRLEAMLSQGDRPIENWDRAPQDWVNDKMEIPLKDKRLDDIRISVTSAIGDSGTFKQLTPVAKLRIQEVIEKLSSK
ncbi:MAG: hypothetical protein AB7K68_03000 [Bacteriovoracia bacterium]